MKLTNKELLRLLEFNHNELQYVTEHKHQPPELPQCIARIREILDELEKQNKDE